ncbi:MAG: DUF3006 domain-containing protein [Synergistaceae bacterium]|jgi:hypothetical protein|nr:DUF3006 domain-containing protein [Synergistaceae bacterium]
MDKPRFFVDAISGGFARLLTGDGNSLTVPLSAIPEGAREGDWLRASFETDPEQKARALGEIEDLYNDLGDNP